MVEQGEGFKDALPIAPLIAHVNVCAFAEDGNPSKLYGTNQRENGTQAIDFLSDPFHIFGFPTLTVLTEWLFNPIFNAIGNNHHAN